MQALSSHLLMQRLSLRTVIFCAGRSKLPHNSLALQSFQGSRSWHENHRKSCKTSPETLKTNHKHHQWSIYSEIPKHRTATRQQLKSPQSPEAAIGWSRHADAFIRSCWNTRKDPVQLIFTRFCRCQSLVLLSNVLDTFDSDFESKSKHLLQTLAGVCYLVPSATDPCLGREQTLTPVVQAVVTPRDFECHEFMVTLC